MNDLPKITKKELKSKMLGFRATSNEVRKLKAFCRQRKASQSELFRYAIRQILGNF